MRTKMIVCGNCGDEVSSNLISKDKRIKGKMCKVCAESYLGNGEAKHTPGPWEIEGTKIVSYARLGKDDAPETVIDCRGAMSGENVQADKRLIAAAPELLKALKAVKEAYNLKDDALSFQETMDSVMDFVNVAIAKAEGRA